MWMWLCAERELFMIWKQSQNEEGRKKYHGAKKIMLGKYYLWL